MVVHWALGTIGGVFGVWRVMDGYVWVHCAPSPAWGGPAPHSVNGSFKVLGASFYHRPLIPQPAPKQGSWTPAWWSFRSSRGCACWRRWGSDRRRAGAETRAPRRDRKGRGGEWRRLPLPPRAVSARCCLVCESTWGELEVGSAEPFSVLCCFFFRERARDGVAKLGVCFCRLEVVMAEFLRWLLRFDPSWGALAWIRMETKHVGRGCVSCSLAFCFVSEKRGLGSGTGETFAKPARRPALCRRAYSEEDCGKLRSHSVEFHWWCVVELRFLRLQIVAGISFPNRCMTTCFGS